MNFINFRLINDWPRLEKNIIYSCFYETKSKLSFYLGYFYHIYVTSSRDNQSNAIKYYNQSILANPKNFQAQFNLAKLYI